MTNGEISPEEKKQEMEKEKLPEDAAAGENQRCADGEKRVKDKTEIINIW